MHSPLVGSPLLPFIALVACVATAGCTRTLVLGSECPESASICVAPDPSQDDERDAATHELDAEAEEPDAEPTPEAGLEALDAEPDSSQPPEDANTALDATPPAPDADAEDAGPPLVPLALRNPEFQRNPGVPTGDIVLANNLLDPLTLGIVISDLPGWYACWVGSVNSVTWELDQNVGVPLYKGDYLSLVLNSLFNNKIEPARQKLAGPMRAGASYAVELDVLSLPDNGALPFVEIRGYDSDCGDGTLLARSATLPSRSWSPICLTFTPDRAYSHFSIGTGFTGPQPSTNARVRIDSLRQLRSCPAPTR